jgi:hypothetical protein
VLITAPPRIPIAGIIVLAGLAMGFNSLRADVIYTNFGTGDAYAAATGMLVTNDGLAWSSAAIAFTPVENYTLTSIEFVATSLLADSTDFVTLDVFTDNGGQPSSTVLESFTAGPLGQFGDTVPVMTGTSVLQPLLLAGTQYWIGMNAPAGDFIVWNQNTTLADGFSQTDGSGNWSTSDADQGVIEIDGTPSAVVADPDVVSNLDSLSYVPEPGSWWLMAMGLTVIGCFPVGQALSPAQACPRPGTPVLRQPKITTR